MKERPIHLVLLEEELKRKKRVNARFSLRSFAKMIGADPSHLSKILQCDKPLTVNIAKRFIEKSELTETEKSLFWDSFIREREKSFGEKTMGLEELTGQKPQSSEAPLTNETFYIISEPSHWAVLEATRVAQMGNDPEMIANKLGLSVIEVTSAISRMVRCGFLKRTETGVEAEASAYESSKNTTIADTAQALHHKRVMEKAAIALDRVPAEQRAQECATFAIDASKLATAQARIQDFVAQLVRDLGASNASDVYQLSMS
ncbi:MAG: TIGR02147 family protein, partial [Proteobacteria bacterium]